MKNIHKVKTEKPDGTIKILSKKDRLKQELENLRIMKEK